MDYKALAELFRNAPEAPAASQYSPGVAYLLEHVLFPLLEAQDVLLENIDLSRFSSEDLREIMKLSLSCTDKAIKTGRLYSALKSAAPSSLPTRYL